MTGIGTCLWFWAKSGPQGPYAQFMSGLFLGAWGSTVLAFALIGP